MPESPASTRSDHSNTELTQDERGKYFYKSAGSDGITSFRELGYRELISVKLKEAYHSILVDRLARMSDAVRGATIGRIEQSLENIRDVIADLMTGRRRTQEFFKEPDPDWLPTPGQISQKTVPSKLENLRRQMKGHLGKQYASRGSDEDAIKRTEAYFAAIRERNAQDQKSK